MTVLDQLRTAIENSTFHERVYVVGGAIRDRLLGLPPGNDLDLVVLGDAVALARFLAQAGLSEHSPVVYPRFGTARVQIRGVGIELATARSESYEPRSRKPFVRPASLLEDVMRRDFTVNTLLEGLHDAVLLDLTGNALPDLDARIIRTPMEPGSTFQDDPLRMFRAIRFAVTLGFTIEARAWDAVRQQAHRVDLLGANPRVVSAERIRDEFVKIISSRNPRLGLELLEQSGLLARIMPELVAMRGVEQNEWHSFDVWDHTMEALCHLPASAPLSLRLAVLFHDVGKPVTRSVDERGVHFYRHETVGAEMTRRVLQRLRLPSDVIAEVSALVALHMRLGQVRPDWSDAAIRRLIRDTSPRLDALYDLAKADMAAMSDRADPTDLRAVRERVEQVNRQMNVAELCSPLDGRDIMAVLGIAQGPLVGRAKEYLVSRILEGTLAPGDREGAIVALKTWVTEIGESD